MKDRYVYGSWQYGFFIFDVIRQPIAFSGIGVALLDWLNKNEIHNMMEASVSFIINYKKKRVGLCFVKKEREREKKVKFPLYISQIIRG